MADALTFGAPPEAVAWLLTYLVHSTVLIGGAWLAVRLGLAGGPDGRDALWKTALVAGLLTASVQSVVAARRSTVGEARAVWAFRTVEDGRLPSVPVDVFEEFDVVVHRREARTPSEDTAAWLKGLPGIEARLTKPSAACVAALRSMATGEQLFQGAPEVCAGRAFDWQVILLALWGIGAALLVSRLALSRIGLRAALAGKVDIESGEAREILDELIRSSGLRGGVRLTASPALESPAVVGSREICLPLRAECGLTPPELRVVLAHELCHMTRRDPLWTMAARLLAALFYIQPLNRLAIREMEAEAEFLCDDWAVRQTGEPIALARSLTRISEWLTSPPPAPVLAVVRDTGSALGRRVRRILTPPDERPRGGRVRVLAIVALLLGATAFLPTLTLPGPSRLHVVALEDSGLMAARLGTWERELPSRRLAVFIRAVRAEVTAP